MRDMTPLCDMARKWHTDKGGRHLVAGETCHEYTPIYWDLLKDRRNTVTNVLEIGVKYGCSLRMWREFFPNAQIIGLDSNAASLYQEDRIHCFAADQGLAGSLLQAMARCGAGPFDLIVDDGSHETHHQVLTMSTLLPFLAPDGIYVIEDVQIDCHPELLGRWVPQQYRWEAITCEIGLGKAHCPCPECDGKGPEQLVVVHG